MDGWFDHVLLGVPRLRDCASANGIAPDGQKQKQVERASNKVRFDGGINLLFHGVVLVRILIFPDTRLHLKRDTPFTQARQAKSILF